MKKNLFKITLLLLLVFAPSSALAMGHVDVGMRIPLPPPFLLPIPPWLVIIPETDVYVAPEVHEDIYFHGGWWWRPWQNRWYRSRHYDKGWKHYGGTPSFYSHVPSNWRGYYNQQRWQGWERNRHWEKQNYWGVRGMGSQETQSRQFNQRQKNYEKKGDFRNRR